MARMRVVTSKLNPRPDKPPTSDCHKDKRTADLFPNGRSVVFPGVTGFVQHIYSPARNPHAGCHQHHGRRKLAGSRRFDKLTMSGLPGPLVLSLSKDPQSIFGAMLEKLSFNKLCGAGANLRSSSETEH